MQLWIFAEFLCKTLLNATNIECFQSSTFTFSYSYLCFKSNRLHAKKLKDAKNAIKDGGSTTMHSKAKDGKKNGLDLKTFFFFGFREFLENFQEISNSREFSRIFTSRSRSRCIFISLFTPRKEWIRFSFHFSLLEKSESDFHFTFHVSKRVKQIFISLFTSRTFNIHSRRTLVCSDWLLV